MHTHRLELCNVTETTPPRIRSLLRNHFLENAIFIPTDETGADVLAGLFEYYPIQSISDRDHH